MKKPPIKLFAALLLFVICSCDKNTCNQSYTISGTLLDGKTGLPIADSGTYIYFDAAPYHGANNLPNISVMAYPDKNGKFSMAYKCCGWYNNTGYFAVCVPHKYYYLFNPYDSFGNTGLPVQQNINRTWTAAAHGWLVIYLQPLSPLLPGDTLIVQTNFFSSYSNPDSTHTFTFLTTQTGVLDSVYLPIAPYSINWGRGQKNLQSNRYSGPIFGDPNISRYTIKY